MATATDTEAMIELAGARGYTLLSAQIESAGSIRKKADRYARAAKAAGRTMPLSNLTVARYIYLADSRREAMDDLRPAFTYELGYQKKRGFIRLINASYGLSLVESEVTFDQLAEAGIYYLGDPDTVARQLREFYDASGGFGTLLRTGRPARKSFVQCGCSWNRWRRNFAASCRRAIRTWSRREGEAEER